MTNTSGEPRFDSIDRVIALGLVIIFLAACKDSTSPAATPSAIAVVSGGSQTAVVGTALAAPVVVKVTDPSGNAVAGVAVTFSPTAAAGASSASQVTTDATGSAQVVWTLGTVAGLDSMTIDAGSLPSTVVVATATPGAPASIAVTSGNDQSAPVDSTLTSALAVKITDQYGNAIPNVTVQWSDDAGGTFSAATSVTDANGIAQVQYTLGPNAGQENVTATLVSGSTQMSTSFVEMGN